MDADKQITTLSLTLVRHGETEANRNGIIQGQSNSSLSENGKRQAQQAGIALQEHRFDRIYSSPLERAFDTATIIATKNFHVPILINEEKHNIVEGNELLQERCYGIFEMKHHTEFKAAAQKAGYGKNIYDYQPEGGECVSDVKKRVIEFLDYLKKTASEDFPTTKILEDETRNILVMSHSAWIRQMVIHLFEDCGSDLPSPFKDLDGTGREELFKKTVKNTAISNFDLQIDINTHELLSVKCNTYACAKHLQSEE